MVDYEGGWKPVPAFGAPACVCEKGPGTEAAYHAADCPVYRRWERAQAEVEVGAAVERLTRAEGDPIGEQLERDFAGHMRVADLPARFSVGDAVRTPAGARGRVVCVDAKGDWPVVALVEGMGGEEPRQFNEHGWCRECAQYGPERNQQHDLLPAPRRAVVWVNVCRGDLERERTHLLRVYPTRAEADESEDGATEKRVGRVRVELEEGRFDE